MMEQQDEYHIDIQKRSWWKKIFFLFFILFIIFPVSSFFTYFFISGPAENFPIGIVFDIKKGMSGDEIAIFLEENNYIKSAQIFKLYDKYYSWKNNDYSGIKAGKYNFKDELDVFGVYNRLKRGISGIDDIKITILEGEASFLIAEKFAKNNNFKNFSKERFLELAKKKEGYLYPDTYSFSPYVTEETIVKSMESNFYKKVGDLKEKVDRTNKSFSKILIMASLIENEAGSAPMAIKKKVSGILWRRLEIGMPLQVDAVFDYIYQKHIPRKLFSHLKIDSPYNTYQNKGLPPGPIGNPSVKSIKAAMDPTKTKDLFYITGKDGNFYYSETASGHYSNISKYITNYKVPEEKEPENKNIES